MALHLTLSNGTSWFHTALVFCFSIMALPVCATDSFTAIPYPLSPYTSGGEVSIESDKITVIAFKGTDLFTDAKGTVHAQAIPKATFKPSGDFELTTKVEAVLDDAYDGAGLVIFESKELWAKIIFERFKSGRRGVASTVVNVNGDDAYHGFDDSGFIYLRLTRKGDVYFLQTSTDHIEWAYKRSFNLGSNIQPQIGFMSQSPIGEEVVASFSQISFVQKRELPNKG